MSDEIRNVTPRDAKRLMDEEGYRYLDVRSEPEFEQGHAEGAVNIPIMHMDPSFGMQPNPDFLAVVKANFPPEAKLVLGCKSGGRSMRAAEVLSRAGYVDVVNVDGGFGGRYDMMGNLAQAGWSQESLPVSDDTGEGVGYASLAEKAK